MSQNQLSTKQDGSQELQREKSRKERTQGKNSRFSRKGKVSHEKGKLKCFAKRQHPEEKKPDNPENWSGHPQLGKNRSKSQKLIRN